MACRHGRRQVRVVITMLRSIAPTGSGLHGRQANTDMKLKGGLQPRSASNGHTTITVLRQSCRTFQGSPDS